MRQLANYLLLVAIVFGSLSVSAQTPANTSASKQAEVFFTAVDKDKNPIADLDKGDIALLVDGVPQQVMGFDWQFDAPLAVSILIDTSMSLEERVPAERGAALSLLSSILRPGKDSALIATFTDSVNVEQKYTSDLKSLQAAAEHFKFLTLPKDARGNTVIPNKAPDHYMTAIWDAVWITCEYILPQGPADFRNVIILLSDGDDVASQKKLDEAIEHAIRSKAIVYVLRFTEKPNWKPGYIINTDAMEFNTRIEKNLKRLTGYTGGRVFSIKNEADLQAAIAQLAQEVHHQYKITYTPKNSGSGKPERQLEIKVVNPEKKRLKIDVAYPHSY